MSESMFAMSEGMSIISEAFLHKPRGVVAGNTKGSSLGVMKEHRQTCSPLKCMSLTSSCRSSNTPLVLIRPQLCQAHVSQ